MVEIARRCGRQGASDSKGWRRQLGPRRARKAMCGGRGRLPEIGSGRRRQAGPRWRQRTRTQPVGSDIGTSRSGGEANSHPAPHVGRPHACREVGPTRVTAAAEIFAAGAAPYGPCGAPIRKPPVPPVPAFSADPISSGTLSRDIFSAADATVAGPRTFISTQLHQQLCLSLQRFQCCRRLPLFVQQPGQRVLRVPVVRHNHPAA